MLHNVNFFVNLTSIQSDEFTEQTRGSPLSVRRANDILVEIHGGKGRVLSEIRLYSRSLAIFLDISSQVFAEMSFNRV